MSKDKEQVADKIKSLLKAEISSLREEIGKSTTKDKQVKKDNAKLAKTLTGIEKNLDKVAKSVAESLPKDVTPNDIENYSSNMGVAMKNALGTAKREVVKGKSKNLRAALTAALRTNKEKSKRFEAALTAALSKNIPSAVTAGRTRNTKGMDKNFNYVEEEVGSGLMVENILGQPVKKGPTRAAPPKTAPQDLPSASTDKSKEEITLTQALREGPAAPKNLTPPPLLSEMHEQTDITKHTQTFEKRQQAQQAERARAQTQTKAPTKELEKAQTQAKEKAGLLSKLLNKFKPDKSHAGATKATPTQPKQRKGWGRE